MRLLIALLLISLLVACDRQKAEKPQPSAPDTTLSSKAGAVGKIDRSHAGEIAPTIEFTDPDGEPVSLADFRGQPLLLNLWATWCAPCVVEMPALDALAARGDAIRVLAVSQDMEGQEAKVAAFFEERRLKSLEPYQDKQLGLMEKLNAEVLPTTLLYDSEGREVWRVTGAFDWTGAEATKLLAEARPANPRA